MDGAEGGDVSRPPENGGRKGRAKDDRETEGFLDYATQRAKSRRGGKNRVAPLGMTGKGRWWMLELKLRPPEELCGHGAQRAAPLRGKPKSGPPQKAAPH